MEDRKRENPTKIIAISVQMSMRKIIKVLANWWLLLWLSGPLGRSQKRESGWGAGKKTGTGSSSDKKVSAKELLDRRKAERQARLEGRGGGGDDWRIWLPTFKAVITKLSFSFWAFFPGYDNFVSWHHQAASSFDYSDRWLSFSSLHSQLHLQKRLRRSGAVQKVINTWSGSRWRRDEDEKEQRKKIEIERLYRAPARQTPHWK